MLTHSEKVKALRMIVTGYHNKAIMDAIQTSTGTRGDIAQLRLQLKLKSRGQYRMEKAKEMIAGMTKDELTEIRTFLRGMR